MFESWKEREFEKKMERFRTALQEHHEETDEIHQNDHDDLPHQNVMALILIPLFECSKRLHGKTDHEEGNHIF